MIAPVTARGKAVSRGERTGSGVPVVVSSQTSTSLSGANDSTLSQAGAGGLHAGRGDHRGEMLSYSSNCGASWVVPARYSQLAAG